MQSCLQSACLINTSTKLAEKLNEAVASWDITGKIIACVYDNAKNIVAANDQTRVSWDSVPCLGHTLQLAMKDGFNIYLNRVIAAAGRLVLHFNQGGIRSVTCLPGSWNKGGQ